MLFTVNLHRVAFFIYYLLIIDEVTNALSNLFNFCSCYNIVYLSSAVSFVLFVYIISKLRTSLFYHSFETKIYLLFIWNPMSIEKHSLCFWSNHVNFNTFCLIQYTPRTLKTNCDINLWFDKFFLISRIMTITAKTYLPEEAELSVTEVPIVNVFVHIDLTRWSRYCIKNYKS